MKRLWCSHAVVFAFCVNDVTCFTWRGDNDYMTSEPTLLWMLVLGILLIVTVGMPLAYLYFSHARKKTLRTLSLFYWILFWIFLPFVIGCYSSTTCSGYSKSLDVVKVTGTYLLPVMYFVVLYESWNSKEKRDIIQLRQNDVSVTDLLHGLRKARPVILWNLKCFHMEWRQDEDQDWYEEEEVTHEVSEEFEFADYTDTSTPTLDGLGDRPMILLKLEKQVEPGDEETEFTMTTRHNDFISRYRRDQSQRHKEEIIIPGFKPRFISFIDESTNSWWIGNRQFCVASILALTWLYRWMLKFRTTRANFVVKKKIFCRKQERTQDKRTCIEDDKNETSDGNGENIFTENCTELLARNANTENCTEILERNANPENGTEILERNASPENCKSKTDEEISSPVSSKLSDDDNDASCVRISGTVTGLSRDNSIQLDLLGSRVESSEA